MLNCLDAVLAVKALVKFKLIFKILFFFDLQLNLKVIIHDLLFLLINKRVSFGHDFADFISVLVLVALFNNFVQISQLKDFGVVDILVHGNVIGVFYFVYGHFSLSEFADLFFLEPRYVSQDL